MIWRSVAFGAALWGGLFAAPGLAMGLEAWKAEKCRLYVKAWNMVGRDAEVSDAFRAAQEAFVAADCAIRGAVCPVSETKWHIAETLTLILVTEGATGSFLPVHCPE